ncbi:MAG: glycosyltransferase family 9 protein [Gemmatimonadaceae bacterium]
MAAEEGQPQRRESILVVSLDNLGDLVFASALLPAIRKEFPSATIGLWCKSYASGLAALIPDLDIVYAADPFWLRSPGTDKGSFWRFIAVAASVRRARFDKAVVFSAPWRAAATVAATRIPVRIGFERRKNRRWLTNILLPPDRQRPVLAELGRLLEPLGIHAPSLVYRLDASTLVNEHTRVSSIMQGRSYVALHPFAGSQSRCVSLDEWISVANELASDDIQILWIGTSKELGPLKKRSEPNSKWHYVDDLSGGSLAIVAVSLSRAKLFIGHDSGPMHIAAALSVPTLGVFAPGEPARTFPQGPGPWRIISRSSPREISARDILAESNLLLASLRT